MLKTVESYQQTNSAVEIFFFDVKMGLKEEKDVKREVDHGRKAEGGR